MDKDKEFWRLDPPPSGRVMTFADLPQLTVTQLAEWTLFLEENNADGTPIDPVAIDMLKAGYAQALHQQLPGETAEQRELRAVRISAELRASVKLVHALNSVNEAMARKGQERYQAATAPKVGWSILSLVCDREDLERSAGDLEEWYPIYLRERGRIATDIWYWAQIARTVLNRAWPAIERGLKLAEFFGKFSSN